MKKLLLLFTFMGFASGIFAQVSKTLNMATAGTLSTKLTSNELTTITNLTLTGTIDARDFKTMRDNMPLVAVLDLSGATTVAYYGIGGTKPLWGDLNYSLNAIPDYAFFNQGTWQSKKSLISIVLPSSVTSIGNSAFLLCSGLITVVIPSSVTSIGDNAFYYCSGLTAVTIPSSVTSIGNGAFYGCSGLTTVAIPSSVTSIGIRAFSDCSGLTTVTIPTSVTSIGDYAFAGCSGLTLITTSRITPLVLSSSNVFQNVDKTICTLNVPVGTKSAYQAANQWKDFTNIVEKNLTGIDPIISDRELIVYPNPTSGNVKVVFDQIPQGGTILTVNDLTGKTILTQFIQNKEESINLGGNTPGVYLIRTNMKGFKVQKVILK